VDAFGIRELYSYLPEKQTFVPELGEEVVARTAHGDPCGIRKRVGEGEVTVLGFAFGYSTDDHLALLGKVLSRDHIRGPIRISDPDVQYVVRHGARRSYLFLLNHHGQPKTVTIGSRHHRLAPFSWKLISQPPGRV
jgi:hypothetical protein